MTIATLADLVFHVRDLSAGRPDLLATTRRGRREVLSTSDFLGSVHALALALLTRGVAQGERIALFAEHRPEWHVVDFACQLLGVVSVPIHPDASSEQVGYLLRNSGASWVFFSGRERGELLTGLRHTRTRPPRLVALDEEPAGDGGLSLVPLLGEGAAERSTLPLERLRGRVQPSDLASIVYTSGTSGEPRGAMLSHRNLVASFLAAAELFPLDTEDLALCGLPLSRPLARTAAHLFFYRGAAIHYAPTLEQVVLREVRPTALVSPPALFEHAYRQLTARLAGVPARRRRFISWAIAVGRRYTAARATRAFVGPWLGASHALAERLLYRRVQRRFGGRLRLAVCGDAPLDAALSDFYTAVGIGLYQVYGPTESGGLLAANSPASFRLGSVGRRLDGVELRLDADGEILARGDLAMTGYWENPAATADVLTTDGWLRTGDVGRLDGDGYVFLTDRKQDLLVTAAGQVIAPRPIEQRLTNHPIIAQAVVVGDRAPYLSALLVPRVEGLRGALSRLEVAELIRHPAMIAAVEAAVAATNRELGEHEQLRRFTLLPATLSPLRGELTPTLKLRRQAISQRYANTIAAMYPRAEPSTATPTRQANLSRGRDEDQTGVGPGVNRSRAS